MWRLLYFFKYITAVFYVNYCLMWYNGCILRKGENTMENSFGIIGGMGPMATELFYKMLIEKTDAPCDQDHMNTIILGHAQCQTVREPSSEIRNRSAMSAICSFRTQNP